MGDQGESHQNSNTSPPRGFDVIKQHIIDNKVNVGLWATRLFTILFTFFYFIPIIGNPYTAYYKALVANAVTSGLRLYQRQTQNSENNFSFTIQYLSSLLKEDSCHYLFYSLIFLYVSPVTFGLLPVFLFSVIHFSSYSLTILDLWGHNSCWPARLVISLVEFQSRNLLRLIAFFEIILMPYTVFLIFMGRAGLLTPFVYYHFLYQRYNSGRNPYSRNMFHELRLLVESIASKRETPAFISRILISLIAFTCRLGPPNMENGHHSN